MYPQVFGKYVLERELARGGMARVLLATLRGAGGFEKKLVVKQIRDELSFDEDFVRRFVEEAKTTVALAHPNIVPVYELGVELGTYFLAMEFVEGASIAEILKSTGKMSPEEGAYVGVELCRALDYAHRRMKVVHRDITPRNVMVDDEGQVKVIDFGIATRSSVAGHGVFGSPGHMPPEQAAGREVTPATDVFAAAVLLMEVWTGRPPFRHKDDAECERRMLGPHPKPSDGDIRLLPLDDVIGAAMSLDPAARPQAADELGRALRKFLSGVDAADVARALGERVRQHRAIAPKQERPKGLERPPSRPHEFKTRTFAARPEVLVGDSAGPDKTRKISGSEPPVPPPLGPVRAMAPTPIMGADLPPTRVERASDAQSAPAAQAETQDPPSPRVSTPVPSSGPSHAGSIETVATVAIETERRPDATLRRRLAVPLMAVGAAAAVAVGAYFLGRGVGIAARVGEVPTAPVSARPPPLPPATASVAVRRVDDAGPAAPPSSGTVATSTPPPASAPPSAQPRHSAAIATGRLRLFGDPGTVVAVDGVPRGACPLELDVEPGPHSVTFTWGQPPESLSGRVTVPAGGRAALRADFMSATPAIRAM